MAIKIKRTPVLEGKAAKAFMESLKHTGTKASDERIRSALEQSKKILAASKTKAK